MKLLATVLAFLAVAWLIGTLLVFQRRKLFYSPVRQTIGELAEFGFPPFREVSRHGFLPTGLLVIAFCASAALALDDETLQQALALYALVGVSYIGCAFFPVDSGAPMTGSWRNNIHMMFAIAGYLGGIAALYLLERHLVAGGREAAAAVLRTLAFAVIAGVVLMNQGWLARWRGAVQRVVELVLFSAMPLFVLLFL